MARLTSKAATIEIRPIRKETTTSNWIETVAGIEYHIQNQQLHVELPTDDISVQLEEFDRFINKCHEYIMELPVGRYPKGLTVKPYYFTPIESRFHIELSSGIFYDDNRHNGSLIVSFEMSLSTLQADDIILDSIGCTVQVSISDLLQFLSKLDQEVKVVANL